MLQVRSYQVNLGPGLRVNRHRLLDTNRVVHHLWFPELVWALQYSIACPYGEGYIYRLCSFPIKWQYAHIPNLTPPGNFPDQSAKPRTEYSWMHPRQLYFSCKLNSRTMIFYWRSTTYVFFAFVAYVDSWIGRIPCTATILFSRVELTLYPALISQSSGTNFKRGVCDLN